MLTLTERIVLIKNLMKFYVKIKIQNLHNKTIKIERKMKYIKTKL